MAKNRQIKHIRIDTETKGSKQAQAELASLNQELDNLNAGVTSFNKRTTSLSKSMTTLTRRSTSLSKNLNKIADSAKAMNKAMNGDTKTASKNISAYMDNLELVSIALRDVERQATGAANALERVGKNASGMHSYSSSMDDMLEGITDLNSKLKELIYLTERQTNAIFDVETQSKKSRSEQQKYNTSIDGTTEAIRRGNKAHERMANNNRNSRNTLSALAKIGGPLTFFYATMAANVFALSEAFEILNAAQDRARFADQVQPQLVLEYGASLGYAAKGMTDFGLAYEEATRKASKGATMGLDSAQMSDIVQIAKKASIVLGRDFSESVDRLTLGIAKQERELLDEFGIIVSLTEAQEKYAATLGKTRQQLSSYERQQAFANAVTKEGLSKFKDINASLTSTEIVLRDVKNSWEQFTIGIARGTGILGMASKGIGTIGKGILDLGRIFTNTDDYFRDYDKFIRADAAYQKALKGGNAEEIAKTRQEMQRLGKEFYYASDAASDWFENLRFNRDQLDHYHAKAVVAAEGLYEIDTALINLSERLRVEAKSIQGAWEETTSSFKQAGQYSTIISELESYMKLSKDVANNEGKLSETSVKRFKVLQETLKVTADQAKEVRQAFINLNDLGLDRNIELNTMDLNLETKSGAGADASLNMGIAQANREFREQAIIVENLAVLFAKGTISVEKFRDESFKYALVLAKLNAERAKLHRLEEASRNNMGAQVLDHYVDQQQILVGNERAKVKLAKERIDAERRLLELRYANQEIDRLAFNEGNNALNLQADGNNAAGRGAFSADAGAWAGTMQGLSGLSDLQNTGLGMAENFASTFAAAQEAGVGFSEFLKANAEAFMEFSVTIANAANSIFLAISEARIAGIDREIAAEKRKDGKSKESLEKIKQLEAKKIKEKEKTGIAQVAISTAMAIMQGYAQMGPIAGSFAAVAMLALGALQISNIKKAAGGQMAALDGGSGASSIQAGSRNNHVDVSQAANAGEYAYVSGQAGMGSGANNFVPGRAGGGYSGAGTGIMVGERGPEMITPTIPVNVTPAGDSNKGSKIVFSPQFNLSTVDASGMGELLDTYSTELYNGLERELNARGKSLESLIS